MTESLDASARQLMCICRKYGREITPKHAQQITDLTRKMFGTAFSAADIEWNESRILDRMEAMLESGELVLADTKGADDG